MVKPKLARIRAGNRELRRVRKHGLSYPWRRYIYPARILNTPAIRTQAAGDVTVCVLTCRKDWHACLWALVSFYELSGLRLPLLIYSDGTLGVNQIRSMARVFPDARIVSPADTETAISAALSRYPNCIRFRSDQVYSRKIIDLPIVCGSPFLLTLDSDVLFFSRPDELIRQIESVRSGCFVFERDAEESYFESRENILKTFNVSIASRVNSGIMLADIARFDFARIDGWLGADSVRKHQWVEQTLWAMYAGEARTTFLGEFYDVTTSAKIEPGTVAKHYITPIRDFMYMDGIPHLSRVLEQKGQ